MRVWCQLWDVNHEFEWILPFWASDSQSSWKICTQLLLISLCAHTTYQRLQVKNSRSSSSQGASSSSSSSSSDRHDTAKKSRKNGQIPISFLDCEVPDEVIFLDPHGGNKFYAEVAVKGITVKLGDFVRATLEADSYQKFSTAICQVLAIFDDVEKGLGVFIEVRWLVRVAELTEKKRKTWVSMQSIARCGDCFSNLITPIAMILLNLFIICIIWFQLLHVILDTLLHFLL